MTYINWITVLAIAFIILANGMVYVATRPREIYMVPWEIIIHDDLTGLESFSVEAELKFLGPGKEISPIIRLLSITKEDR